MKRGLIIAAVAVGVVGFVVYNRYKKTDEGVITTAVEAQSASFEGFAKLNDKTFENLQVMGDAELENVQIIADATITGMLTAKKLIAKNLQVVGNAKLEQATIEIAQITGMLDAKGCSIQDLYLVAQTAMMDACKIKTITVKKVEGYKKPQILELNNTQIEGDVTFQAGSGEVILKGDARIAGAIVGGAIKQ